METLKDEESEKLDKIPTSETNPTDNNNVIIPEFEPNPPPTPGFEPMLLVPSSEIRTPAPNSDAQSNIKTEPLGFEDISIDSISDNDKSKSLENSDTNPAKRHKSLAEIDNVEPQKPSKKKSSKKKIKGNNVWTKTVSRKGKKKAKNNNYGGVRKEENPVFISPMLRFPDRNDDSPEAKICLSKVYKAEKVELSEDRLTAGSCKGYRMVRATRGVTEGAWYFEIRVVNLGETGHTRLGWTTEKGDLQAPVGYDSSSFGYRDVDGSRIHKALREKYGEEEGYKEGDVIGFYINLPDGNSYAPKLPQVVWYKGQRYICAPDPKEDPPKIVPGSQITFFKNGISQGVAFKDICGGCYYPAASMYTLPNQPNCVVKFNFGPVFECFPADFGDHPVPKPMIEVPYSGLDNGVENGASNYNKQ